MELLRQGSEELGIRLDESQIKRFEIYYRKLVRWNEQVNLTAVTDRNLVQTRHFLDSLSAAQTLPSGWLVGKPRFLDIGSGAGFPGLPLKITFPTISLTLLEATAKKVEFLESIVGLLDLTGVNVRVGRAEELAHTDLRESFDVVVARAVAKLPILVELALPFCRVGGLLIAQKGANVEAEIAESQVAIQMIGGEFRDNRQVIVPGSNKTRSLIVIEKMSQTPSRYPRRTGMPAKRPLQSL